MCFRNIDEATPYAGNPETLANYVYANRNGNGNTQAVMDIDFAAAGSYRLREGVIIATLATSQIEMSWPHQWGPRHPRHAIGQAAI